MIEAAWPILSKNAQFIATACPALARACFHAAPLWVFITAAAAIVPLARWVSLASEQLARRGGSSVGGLLNVTFSNAPEFIVALFVLYSGQTGVVKAMITGSIIGNSLLGLGVAIPVGSWGREKQIFKREGAGLLASLFILSVIGLLVPALFDYTEQGLSPALNRGLSDERLSLGVSAVLVSVYACNLFYTLFTHRGIFSSPELPGRAAWTPGKSLAVLLAQLPRS